MSKGFKLEINEDTYGIADKTFYIPTGTKVKLTNFAAMSALCDYGYNIQLLLDDVVINEAMVGGIKEGDQNLMFGNFAAPKGNMDYVCVGKKIVLRIEAMGGGTYMVRALLEGKLIEDDDE